MVRYVQERLPLFLDPSDVAELKEKLTDEGIRRTIADDRQLIEDTPFPEMKQIVLRDPLQLAPLMLRRLHAIVHEGATAGDALALNS